MFSRASTSFVLALVAMTSAAFGQTASPQGSASRAVTSPPTAAPDFYAPDPDLAAYIRAALSANPGVQASLASYRATLETVTVAKALPDPMLTVGQAIAPVQTRVGPQRDVFTVSQAFPWFGTLDLRSQVAGADAAAAEQAYRARQRDVIVQVKSADYNLGYVDAALGIAHEEQALLDHYEELAQARYASGQGLQQAVIKIQAEITKVVNRLDGLQQQRETLAAQLNTLLNRPPEQPVPAVAPLTKPAGVPLDLAHLESIGDADRPEVKAADVLIDRSRLVMALAHKAFRPNFTVGATFINVGGRTDEAGLAQPPPDNGRNAWSLTFGLNLPLRRGKYRADAQRAAEDLSAATLRRDDAHNAMAFATQDQISRIQTLAEQLRLIGDVLVPQTDEALRSTESAYETGEAGVLDLLDSERSRLDVRLIYARDTADYLVALANLERAIGSPFPEGTRIP